VIGLSTAFELGRAGVRCRVFGAVNHGAASGAAAGLLAPSVGTLRPDVQTFFDASLALYPDFVESLRPFEPDLVLLEGLLDVSSQGKATLSASDVALLEPALAPAAAVFYPRDGAIDNVLLTRALRGAVASVPTSDLVSGDPVTAIRLGSRIEVRTRGGAVVEAAAVVVAAGAWSARIDGLPRELPVLPLKGQMLSVASSVLRRPVMGDDVYIVPRRAEIAIGATAEHAGFDTTVFPDAIERLRQSAVAVCPFLADAPVVRTWAGIRPATPDMLPVLGRDPDFPSLIYACGHSKNGILLAPATAKCIAALATGTAPPFDIDPFSVRRFSPPK
jgi:glycine/D-amino acid oxidase-like deaminating enzyme